jgi:hypothetical protein
LLVGYVPVPKIVAVFFAGKITRRIKLSQIFFRDRKIRRREFAFFAFQ